MNFLRARSSVEMFRGRMGKRINMQQIRWKKKIWEEQDPIDHATGLEKREMLAKLAGNDDPWDEHVVPRGPGTQQEPTEIPSAFDKRLMGCICDDVTCHINYQWLYKDEPSRCGCGHWFKLVYKPPL